jgi:L-seryl-tRNA(Ser) seleniumtransferase
VKSAWIHSAPHHGYGRSTKVGKEEAMGMLEAVEMWVKRDHKAEWAQWLAWLDHIAKRVSALDGVTASVRETEELSNHSPTLSIRWNTDQVGILGDEVSRLLWSGEPRIALNGGGRRGRGGAPSETGVSIVAHMMSPGDEKVVADRLFQVLSTAPKRLPARESVPPATDVTGEWNVRIEFAGGSSTHFLFLQQREGQIQGTHRGDFVARDLSGTIEGDAVRFTSNYTEQHGDALTFRFTGTVTGDQMGGDLDMGEYLAAKWSATRHQYGRG